MSAVLGHRGASGQHHENTLEAFRVAYEQGAAGVEFDVRRSADGIVVVHHDAVLADGRAIVATERDDLPALIPTLADVIALSCQARPDAVINIEIKSERDDPDFDDTYQVVASVLDVVKQARTVGAERAQVWVTSFDSAAIAEARAIDPSTRTGPISETLLDIERVVGAGHEAVMVWFEVLTADYVAAAHQAGLQVGAWTVNELADLERFIGLGVDWVMTDYPERAVAVVASQPRPACQSGA